MTTTTVGGMLNWVAFWHSPLGLVSEVEIDAHAIDMVLAVVGDQPTQIAMLGGKQIEECVHA